MLAFEKRRPLQNTNRPIIWIVLKIALAIFLMGFILSQTSLDELFALLQRVSVFWFVASFFVYGGLALALARRYWILIGKEVAFSQFIRLVILQIVIGNFVATSVGILSYIGMLRGEHQVQMPQSVRSLILARVGDSMMLSFALALSSWVVWSQIVAVHGLLLFLLMGLGCALVAFLLVFIFQRHLATAVSSYLETSPINRTAAASWILKKLTVLSGQDSPTLCIFPMPVFYYSILILILMLAYYYCNIQALGAPIGIWPIVLIVSLTQLMALLPIQVFGGLGVFDITSMYLFNLFGMTPPESVAVTIGIRAILYTVNLLLLLIVLFGTWLEHGHEA